MTSALRERVTLAELLRDGLFVDGDWVESKDQDPDGDVRLIQLADVGDGVFRNRSSRFLTSAKARELGCTFLKPGDVLIARMPEPLGRACIFPGVGQPAVTAVDVCILRPNAARVSPNWLVKAINSPDFRESMHQFVRGTTRQRISRKNLGTLLLDVPLRIEQEELSRFVDILQSKRDDGAQHVRAARNAVERFRQAVLATAWHEASEGSASFRLEELLAEPMRNGYSARPTNQRTPFRVLTLTATTSGWFDARHFKYTAEAFEKDSPYWVCPGDILVQRGNTAEYVGVPALYEGEELQFLYPDLIIRVRIHPDVGARYVWYMLLTPQLRDRVKSQATGSAGNMPKINQKVLSDVLIPMPTEDRRTKIVSHLDRALDVAARLTHRIDLASTSIDRSSHAILAKAFRGELTVAATVNSNGRT